MTVATITKADRMARDQDVTLKALILDALRNILCSASGMLI